MNYRMLALLLALSASLRAAPLVTLNIDADKPGVSINAAMWGAFFEDVNFGADGGLYAELIKNRSFEFPDPLMGWFKLTPNFTKGEITVRGDQPLNDDNLHYLRLKSEAKAPLGLSNEGFRGLALRQGETYDFSAWVRKIDGEPDVIVQLVAGDGSILDTAHLTGLASDWTQAHAVLNSSSTETRGRVNILLGGHATADLDMISLFPRHTWKNRPGGLRADMVQALADLHPGFLRFPGGCIVEGSQLERRYQWKNTILPVERRHLLVNRWNYEFLHRPTPDYFQSFGLGFFEFFQLCDDIGARPLPILNCGMACQFNSGELCPLDKLEPFIQDALDLIEFANGPAGSPWGSKRAQMGHPESFHLTMMGIGNEQWGPQYIERYAAFAKVLKEKHPEIQLVSDAGPSPGDERFQYLWPRLCEMHADIVDQHCYDRPDWFFNNTHRYDDYDRNGPKIFMGEYAAQSVATVSPKNRNTLECALAEAAYMTGLERNAGVVRMASYAPLFASTEAWQWTPDLIWCDGLHVRRTPNYYAQQLFCLNRGDQVLPVTMDSGSPRFFASAVRDNNANDIILKAINATGEPVPVSLHLRGVKSISSDSSATVLASEDLNDESASPVRHALAESKPDFDYEFPPHSLTVLRLGGAKN
jgi:alpha-L-arabinofuranosidase